MEYLETDHDHHRSLKENDVEDEILGFVNEIEETVHCEEEEGIAEKSPSVACSQDSDRHNPSIGDGMPRVGMRFCTEDEAYDFYNAYAAGIGFSVRRGGIRHNSKGAVRQRTLVCSKEGLKVDGVSGEAARGNRLETRTDCKACIRLTVTDGAWEVARFDCDHNHELANPEQRKYLRSARKLLEAKPSIPRTPSVVHKEGGVVMVPAVGMKVYSENDAYNLYNLYATQIGFSIRKGGYRFNSKGELRQRNYVCSKQGLRVEDEPDRARKTNRLETRTDCKASIRFTITDGMWEVTVFNSEHNHELVEPDQRKYLRSIRRITLANAGLVASENRVAIRPMKPQSSTEEIGVVKCVRVPSSEHHDFLQTKMSNIIGAEDAQSVVNQLKHKLAADALFFYSVQVDSHSHLANFFWRDGRSRLDYDCFGDVVVLDTSFRTSRYDLVCAPFVGVNNHGKEALFGCAILSDDSISSFSWLLETFLDSMGHRHPKTIFTNHSQALANAIEKVLPRACHRLCVRNIQEYATQRFPNLYSNPDFKAKFDKCLNGCHTEMEFLSTWDELIKGHAENEWLKALYDLRVKWCSALSVDCFSANVRTSHIADSTRNIFDLVSRRMMTLTQLVDQYEEAAERMRLAELAEDVRCNQDLPTRASRNSAMLKQAADVYTIENFKLFQEEMVESLSIVMNELCSNGRLHTYELIEEDQNGRYIVQFNAENCTATCNCKMFESMGLLCRHALRVLNMNNITKLPAQYILKRWTKGARMGIPFPEVGESSLHGAKQTRSLLRNRLMHKAFFAVDRCLQTKKGSDKAEALLDQLIEQAEREIAALDVKDIDSGDSESIHDGATFNNANDTPCLFDSSLSLATLRARPQCQLKKKRKTKNSKSNISSGQQNQPIFVGPPGVLFHQQFPTFFHPSFHPSIVGINGSPYPLHQEHTPTWVLGNIRPSSVLPGTDQMSNTNKDSSKSSDANHREMPQLDQGNNSL